jgi:GPH family glycoside/pentoside/hexuronide:cation symporter
MVGWALFIARLVDSVSDPIVGFLSDRTRHRWGKRLPYMVVGAPLWVLFTILLFTPPVAGQSMANFWYLAGVALLYFIGMTVVQVPYMAALPEITRTETQAIELSVRMGRFFVAGVILSIVSAFPLASACGFAGAAAVLAAIAGITFFFAARDLRAHPDFVTEIIGLDKAAAGAYLLLLLLVAAGVSPLVRRACLRFGKKPVMLAAMLVFAAGFVLWHQVGDPAHWIGSRTLAEVTGFDRLGAASAAFGTCVASALLFALIGIPVAVQILTPPAIMADLVVYDEKRTGNRREALVYGLQGGIEKSAVMAATLATPMVLGLGMSARNPAGIRLVGPMAATACLVGYLVFRFYPLRKGWVHQLTSRGDQPEAAQGQGDAQST